MVYKPVGLSQQIRAGDVLVISDHANEDAGAQPCVRLLHPSDITDYLNTADNVTLGALGVAMHGVTADTSGVATGVPDPVTLKGPKVAFPLQSMAQAVPDEVGGGHSRVLVAYFDDESWYGSTLLETTTINEDLIGTRVGIAITPASGTAVRPLRYQWSTAATVKIGAIVGVNKADPLFNVSGGGAEVLVRVDAAYQQNFLTADYYDQSRSFAA